jgi:acetolactate synthase I/II/III large subunit
MTRRSGAEMVVRSLQAHGIDVVVGLVGDHILPILNLLPDFGIRLLDVRQESAGVHLADGLARARGKATVCLTTGGPGLANSVAGLAVAGLAGSPVIHISGHPGLSTESMGGRQQIDQIGLTSPVTKASRLVRDVRRIPTTLSEAFRLAGSGRPGPVHVTIPLNVQQDSAEESETPEVSSRMPAPAHAAPAAVEEAMGILQRAERPVAIAGGASRFSVRAETLQGFLELTGIPLFTVDQARGLISDEHPQCLGYPDPELNETASLIAKADVVLLIGAKQDFQIKFCHPPFIRADARIVQIDPDVLEIGRNRSVAVGLAGDVGSIIQQSLEAARTLVWQKWPAWLEELQGAGRAYRQGLTNTARADDALPMHPLHVFRAAEDVLPSDATLLFDVGDFGLWGRTYMAAQGPGRWIWPGPLGHLGSTLPMAIGCQVAHPQRPVVCFAGDGAMGFHFMEMDTAVRHGIPVVVVVGNDAAFGIDRNYQVAYYGRSIGTEHRQVRFDRLAMELGGHGEHVERSADLAGALSRALASGRPAVVNVVIRSVPCPLTVSRIRHDSRGARSPVPAAR